MKGQAVSPYRLRRMEFEDIEQVELIEREAFPTLWPPTSYKKELKNGLANYLICIHTGEFAEERKPTVSRDGVISRILSFFGITKSIEDMDSPKKLIVGFIGMWCMADEGHIVSIAVKENYRRKGLGELLLLGSLELAISTGLYDVTLEARVTNYGAHSLYGKYGFHHVGVRKGYYSDNHEDAAIMTTDPVQSVQYKGMIEERRSKFEERYGDIEWFSY